MGRRWRAAPMLPDVAPAKPMLGWTAAAFHSLFVQREDNAGFIAQFDSGAEQKLELRDLRERWTLPVRVLGSMVTIIGRRCSSHSPVSSAFNSLTRSLDGARRGTCRARQPSDPLGAEHSVPGAHIAVLDNWKDVAAATARWTQRGSFGVQHMSQVPATASADRTRRRHARSRALSAVRRPMRLTRLVQREGAIVFACRGEWLPGW